MGSQDPYFSIVTATFNSGELLARTIASLRSQTCKSFEWIVVDGGSKDSSLALIREATDVVDRFISEPDEGISDAWNKGIALARGSHVLILNAGDTYDPTFLAAVQERCDGKRIVCTHARLSAEDGSDAGVFRSEPRKLNRAMHLAHNWCAVPRRHYRELGSYRKIPLAMDFDWFHRYYKRFGVAGFVVIDRVLGSYYLGGKSDTNYKASFRMNETILRENGANVFAAKLVRFAYSLKHALRRRVWDRFA